MGLVLWYSLSHFRIVFRMLNDTSVVTTIEGGEDGRGRTMERWHSISTERAAISMPARLGRARLLIYFVLHTSLHLSSHNLRVENFKKKGPELLFSGFYLCVLPRAAKNQELSVAEEL